MLIRFLVLMFVVFPISCHFVLSNIEKKMVFYPEKELGLNPADMGIEFEDLEIEVTDKIQINAWYLERSSLNNTILYLHGNAGNISDRLYKIKALYDLGFNVLIIDYRGYGKSGGRPSEQGLYSDALAAYNYLYEKKNISANKIIIYGVSLGGAVAVNAASSLNAKALVLENTFSSMRDMAIHIFPGLPKVFVRNRFNSLGKITKIKCPVLFLVTENDDVVPYKLQKKLYDAASEPKTLIKLTGDHNSSWRLSSVKFKQAWQMLI